MKYVGMYAVCTSKGKYRNGKNFISNMLKNRAYRKSQKYINDTLNNIKEDFNTLDYANVFNTYDNTFVSYVFNGKKWINFEIILNEEMEV